MRTFTIENIEYSVPEISVIEDGTSFQIMEGEHQGIIFSIDNLIMDEVEEGLLHYNLNTVDDKDVDKIKGVVDNFILMILYDQILRNQNETSETSPPNA